MSPGLLPRLVLFVSAQRVPSGRRGRHKAVDTAHPGRSGPLAVVWVYFVWNLWRVDGSEEHLQPLPPMTVPSHSPSCIASLLGTRSEKMGERIAIGRRSRVVSGVFFGPSFIVPKV